MIVPSLKTRFGAPEPLVICAQLFTPRGRLKFGRMLACRTQTARNRRVGGASRRGTGSFRAASAQFPRLTYSGFRCLIGSPKVAVTCGCLSLARGLQLVAFPRGSFCLPCFLGRFSLPGRILTESCYHHHSVFSFSRY